MVSGVVWNSLLILLKIGLGQILLGCCYGKCLKDRKLSWYLSSLGIAQDCFSVSTSLLLNSFNRFIAIVGFSNMIFLKSSFLIKQIEVFFKGIYISILYFIGKQGCFDLLHLLIVKFLITALFLNLSAGTLLPFLFRLQTYQSD